MELIDIGGRRLAVSCEGSGSPTVVLETGLGAPARDWASVSRKVSTLTQVCYYDRANCGASDPVDGPRTARDMAEDLHALIHAKLDRPVVLVGHSFGGPICLIYSSIWAEDVAGLVFADPTHPRQFDEIGPMMPNALGPMKEFWTAGWRSTASTAEQIDFPNSFGQIRGIHHLGDLPMVVLTSSAWSGLGGTHVAHEKWVDLHGDYVRLSTRSEQRVVAEQDHFLQTSAPEAVAQAIRDVVDAIM